MGRTKLFTFSLLVVNAGLAIAQAAPVCREIYGLQPAPAPQAAPASATVQEFLTIARARGTRDLNARDLAQMASVANQVQIGAKALYGRFEELSRFTRIEFDLGISNRDLIRLAGLSAGDSMESVRDGLSLMMKAVRQTSTAAGKSRQVSIPHAVHAQLMELATLSASGSIELRERVQEIADLYNASYAEVINGTVQDGDALLLAEPVPLAALKQTIQKALRALPESLNQRAAVIAPAAVEASAN